MVWGSMSSKGVGKLHFIDGDQDGAACHSSKKAIKWMEENNVPLLKWQTKVNRSRSVSKNMVATFVSKELLLRIVITELRKINPESRIILHQDNASWHTAQKTRKYLTEENVESLDHPPYSPDLSPNDFFTFSKIKNRQRGQRLQSPEETVDAFKNVVLDLPANEWNKCFENWFERMLICIHLLEEYFQKQ
ncbi:unnamed protein product [Acanthoscelides obtectus]|uniref:Tc1-like transposase DDE domain-containing protein n=1 Tax=Acanthoscelides obtectus TaxID=200917 RepID=A0A9P0LSM9_ACAOB|nr:unnamed protein product [Acanthoscelides obtectus]CAK1620313.1 Histone-lysine N-methyltransferase SETMAR [Acanthoscelides obtectus]